MANTALANIKSVAIIGAGQMGAGIAQVFAATGYQTILFDTFPGALDKGVAGISKRLDRLIEKEAISKGEKANILGRI